MTYGDFSCAQQKKAAAKPKVPGERTTRFSFVLQADSGGENTIIDLWTLFMPELDFITSPGLANWQSLPQIGLGAQSGERRFPENRCEFNKSSNRFFIAVNWYAELRSTPSTFNLCASLFAPSFCRGANENISAASGGCKSTQKQLTLSLPLR